MAGVTLDPMPFDLVAAGQPVQFLPQIDVLHRLALRGLPTALLPAVDPLADALLHILGIGVHAGPHRPFEGRQRPDHGGQFHPVVGGPGFTATHLLLVPLRPQNRTPAAGTRVAAAGAVGVNLHVIHFKSVSSYPANATGSYRGSRTRNPHLETRKRIACAAPPAPAPWPAPYARARPVESGACRARA